MDKAKVNKWLNALNDNSYNKAAVLSAILEECTYEELEQIYKRSSSMLKGLLSLSFLKRKSYDQIFENNVRPRREFKEYIGVITYIVKHNAVLINNYHELPLDADMQATVTRIQQDRDLLNEIEQGFPYNAGKPDTRLQVHLGPIASVPAVLSSKDEVDKIQKHCRKLLGIEMEGYGVFYAANNSAHPRPKYTMLIKSVSDYADPDKTDNYQEYAMYTSAAFARHIILNELVYE